jgi:hypothetical protein
VADLHTCLQASITTSSPESASAQTSSKVARKSIALIDQRSYTLTHVWSTHAGVRVCAPPTSFVHVRVGTLITQMLACVCVPPSLLSPLCMCAQVEGYGRRMHPMMGKGALPAYPPYLPCLPNRAACTRAANLGTAPTAKKKRSTLPSRS